MLHPHSVQLRFREPIITEDNVFPTWILVIKVCCESVAWDEGNTTLFGQAMNP